MNCDTRGAVSLEVLQEGNTALLANDVELKDPWETSAEFLSESESMLIADAFNGGPSLLFRGEGLDGSGFVSWCPYEMFLFNLAHDIERARLGHQVPRRYVIFAGTRSHHASIQRSCCRCRGPGECHHA